MYTLSAIIIAYVYGQVPLWSTVLSHMVGFGWLTWLAAGVWFVFIEPKQRTPRVEKNLSRFAKFGAVLTLVYALLPSQETVGLVVLAGGGTAAAVAIVNNEEVQSIVKKTANVVENGLDTLAKKVETK